MVTQSLSPHEGHETGNGGPLSPLTRSAPPLPACSVNMAAPPTSGLSNLFNEVLTAHCPQPHVTPDLSQLDIHFLFSKALFTLGGRAAEKTSCRFEMGFVSKLEPL